MTTATLRISTPLTGATATPRKGFLTRFYDALVEARMRQAMREIAMHRHLLPTGVLEQVSLKADGKSSAAR